MIGRDRMKTPKFEALLRVLKHALKVDKRRCVIVGSSALAIRGLRDVRDLDVIVDAASFDRLCTVAHARVDDRTFRGYEYDADKLAVQTDEGVIQVSTDFYNFAKNAGISAAELSADAESWKDWSVISLDHFKRFKKAVSRDKDFDDLQLLQEAGL